MLRDGGSVIGGAGERRPTAQARAPTPPRQRPSRAGRRAASARSSRTSGGGGAPSLPLPRLTKHARREAHQARRALAARRALMLTGVKPNTPRRQVYRAPAHQCTPLPPRVHACTEDPVEHEVVPYEEDCGRSDCARPMCQERLSRAAGNALLRQIHVSRSAPMAQIVDTLPLPIRDCADDPEVLRPLRAALVDGMIEWALWVIGVRRADGWRLATTEVTHPAGDVDPDAYTPHFNLLFEWCAIREQRRRDGSVRHEHRAPAGEDQARDVPRVERRHRANNAAHVTPHELQVLKDLVAQVFHLVCPDEPTPVNLKYGWAPALAGPPHQRKAAVAQRLHKGRYFARTFPGWYVGDADNPSGPRETWAWSAGRTRPFGVAPSLRRAALVPDPRLNTDDPETELVSCPTCGAGTELVPELVVAARRNQAEREVRAGLSARPPPPA